MRYLKTFLIIGSFSLAILYWVSSRPKQEIDWDLVRANSMVREQTPAAAIHFQTPKGKAARLIDFKGKPILLNFWASWCPPCIQELPALLQFAEKAKKELGIEVITVSVDREWKDAAKALLEFGFTEKNLPFLAFWDPEGTAAQTYGAKRFPETFFIDSEFRVRKQWVGPQDWLSPAIWDLLKQGKI